MYFSKGVKKFMKVIRCGVFETNSSSTHSVTICSDEEYTKWEDGELYWSYESFVEMPEEYRNYTDADWYNLLDEKEYFIKEGEQYFIYTSLDFWYRGKEYFDTKTDAYTAHKDWLIDMYLYDFEELYSVKVFNDVKENYDHFCEKYTTPGGDEIVVFGYYGYDG